MPHSPSPAQKTAPVEASKWMVSILREAEANQFERSQQAVSPSFAASIRGSKRLQDRQQR
jgi:hypothetical protein